MFSQIIISISKSALKCIKKPIIPLLIDPNYNETLSDSSYISLCFSNASAWVAASLVMGISVLVLIIFNKDFKKPKDTIETNENNE